MVRRLGRFDSFLLISITVTDLIVFNFIYLLSYHLQKNDILNLYLPGFKVSILIILNLANLLCALRQSKTFNKRNIRVEQMISSTIKNVMCFIMLSVILLFISHSLLTIRAFAFIFGIYLVMIIIMRLILRKLIIGYRKNGGNSRTVLFVGGTSNLDELYHTMISNPITGYKILGYFNEAPNETWERAIPYLGTPHEVIDFLKINKPDQLYCALPSSFKEEILPIIRFCENNFIRFYSVPNFRNYFKHAVKFELIGDTPILGILEEPLEQSGNKFIKRTIDIFFSLLFLITVFPIIFAIISIAIKISSPGPVIFKQLRSGHDGKPFMCYKFRSMRVNAESDTVMATKHDPRKTKIGNFLRKTNIDELPQFYNVLKGEMSIVGPRPHMLKHTEEYSQLIDKFMLRYYVKPGITGWAQVNGYRGEIKELWQMEKRVKYDIWYIEHWSLLLDAKIVFMTTFNMIKGEKNAY